MTMKAEDWFAELQTAREERDAARVEIATIHLSLEKSPTIPELETIKRALAECNHRTRGDHPDPWAALALIAWNQVCGLLEARRDAV